MVFCHCGEKFCYLSVLGANSLGQAPDPAPTKLKNWQPFIALHSKICEICETIFRLRNSERDFERNTLQVWFDLRNSFGNFRQPF